MPSQIGWKVVERNRPAQRGGLLVQRELEARGELNGAEHAQTVVSEGGQIDGSEQAAFEIEAAIERIGVLAGQRVPSDRVDGEVAAPRGLGERHPRIARDGKALMTAS